MAFKYFLYSKEQINEKNTILKRTGKSFVPGTIVIGGSRKKFTQISDKPTIDRYVDIQIVAQGEESTFTYTKPSSTIMKGN